MIYYINAAPTASGNYGNPSTRGGEGRLALPEALLPEYIAAMGFVVPTVAGGAVTAVAVNQAAYDAYMAEHPPEPDGETPGTGTEATVWDELDAAYQEGVDSV